MILNEPSLLIDLLKILKSKDVALKKRASWPLSHLANSSPGIFKPFLKDIVALTHDNSDPAIKRNALKVLEQTATFPPKLHAKILVSCFALLQDKQEPAAIRIYAMSVISNLCRVYPELRFELQAILEEELPYASAGFVSRGKKVLKALQQLPG